MGMDGKEFERWPTCTLRCSRTYCYLREIMVLHILSIINIQFYHFPSNQRAVFFFLTNGDFCKKSIKILYFISLLLVCMGKEIQMDNKEDNGDNF